MYYYNNICIIIICMSICILCHSLSYLYFSTKLLVGYIKMGTLDNALKKIVSLYFKWSTEKFSLRDLDGDQDLKQSIREKVRQNVVGRFGLVLGGPNDFFSAFQWWLFCIICAPSQRGFKCHVWMNVMCVSLFIQCCVCVCV